MRAVKRIGAAFAVMALLLHTGSALALDADISVCCPHHPTHTGSCGYRSEYPDQPCTFVCPTCQPSPAGEDEPAPPVGESAPPETGAGAVAPLPSGTASAPADGPAPAEQPASPAPSASPAQTEITTFTQLKSAIDAAAGSSAVLSLSGEIYMEELLTIPAGTAVTLQGGGTLARDARYTGLFFLVQKGGALNIDGTTLDGRGLAASSNGLICSYGAVALNAGALQGIHCLGGAADYQRSAVSVVGPDATFTMTGGQIRDNTYTQPRSNQHIGAVMAVDGATIELSGGQITQNTLEASISAAVVVFGGTDKEVDSHLYISGDAQITDNVAYNGGVLLGNSNASSLWSDLGLAVCQMDGGLIARNTAQGFEGYTKNYGGGVMVYYHADFTMNGGQILQNTGKMGAGVCVTDGFVESGAYAAGWSYQELWIEKYNIPGAFRLNGGEISGNRAIGGGTGDEGCGGGIYIASNQVTLSGGSITDNSAGRQGGGVYVGCVPYVLHMYDALITDNTAELLGGGLWFCPTGDATNAVTNGGAIYGNRAGGAGDDFVAVPQTGKLYTTNLADRMLGGGAVSWYRDGGVELLDGDQLGQPDQTARFDPQDPGQRLTDIQNSTQGHALKAVVSPAAQQLAQSRAKLYITGNRAPRGGGVGSNGSVIIGTPQQEYTLQVRKVWPDGVLPAAQAAVTVALQIGDYQLDTVVLEQKNSWQATFTQLPDPATLGELQVQVLETPVPDGFAPSYSQAVVDEDAKTISITITNTPLPTATGSLTVEKTVAGTGGETDRDFTFVVQLSDTAVSGVYGEMLFTGGKAQFTLRHGQRCTATGLPAGTTYRVTEAEAGEDGYRTTATGGSGAIAAGQMGTAVFTNWRDSQTPRPPAETETGSPGSPATGGSVSAVLLLISAVAAGSLLLLYRRRWGYRPKHSK